MSVKTIETLGPPREIASGRIVRLVNQDVRLPNGKEMAFEFAERAPGVRVLLVHNDQILLTEESRFEIDEVDYRLPGGKVWDSLEEFVRHYEDSAAGKMSIAVQAAVRESAEEAGIELNADRFEYLHTSVCGSTMYWDLLYFVVELNGDEYQQCSGEIETEEGEHVKSCWYPLDEVLNLCLTTSVQEDRTAAVLMRYILNRKND